MYVYMCVWFVWARHGIFVIIYINVCRAIAAKIIHCCLWTVYL